MLEGLLTLPVLLPVLFWAGYHYHKDRHLPEPPLNLLLCFLMGLGASWVSVGMYELLGVLGLRYDAFALADESLTGLFLYAMLAIGPIEELAKLLPFLIVVVGFRHFDEPIDGIVYASFIALGYAAAENVQYLQFLGPAEAVARGFAGPVVHILFASIWGHWIGMAHLEKRALVPAALIGFLLAAAAHGIYDFIVLMEPVNALPVAALLIVGGWVWRLRLLHLLHLDAVGADVAEHERRQPEQAESDASPEDQPRS